ncbi:hypothetical protein Bbelb_378430 [Branchiostoma belcheri]|nr:hypothetical protein Bbelb_378430 [Branchiostoma belcheri]
MAARRPPSHPNNHDQADRVEPLFVQLRTFQDPLPPKISVGAFVAEFYHREQKEAGRSRAQKCSNCLQEGHHRSMCENEIICHQCKKPGHRRGDPACELENGEVTITSVAETNTGYTSNSPAAPEMERRQESDTGDEASEADETDGEPILDNPEGRTETLQPRGRGYSTRSRTHTSSNVNNQKHARDNNSDNSTPDTHVNEQRDSPQPSSELWLKEQRKAKGKQGAKGSKLKKKAT